jgi:hypothetical protein
VLNPPNRTSAAVSSVAPESPPLSPALGSESVNFATNARGFSGVHPGSVRLRIVTMSASPMGDWLNGERKRLELSKSLIFSTFAMMRFIVLALRGGGTDRTLMHPKKLEGPTGVCEGTAPSST